MGSATQNPKRGVPSAFFEAERPRLLRTGQIGRVLDLACGQGRHALAAANLGLDVLGVDRNPESLAALAAAPRAASAGSIELVEFDLETGALPDWPRERFGAVLVFRYLHRPLAPFLESLLAPGGVLLYETFTEAQRALGWGPSRDDFLLRDGELPTLFPGLTIKSYSQGLSNDEPAAETGRLVATRPSG